ncbi:MAG: hypothetical protein V4623_06880, partial [Pseudomonadota bacterium]
SEIIEKADGQEGDAEGDGAEDDGSKGDHSEGDHSGGDPAGEITPEVSNFQGSGLQGASPPAQDNGSPSDAELKVIAFDALMSQGVSAEPAVLVALVDVLRTLLSLYISQQQVERQLRRIEREAMIGELMNAANETVKAAKSNRTASYVSGALSIGMGAAQMGMGIHSYRMSRPTIKAGQKITPALEAEMKRTGQWDRLSPEARNTRVIRNSDEVRILQESASAQGVARSQMWTNNAYALQALGQTAPQLASAQLEYEAKGHEAAGQENQAVSKRYEDSMDQTKDVQNTLAGGISAVLEALNQMFRTLHEVDQAVATMA